MRGPDHAASLESRGLDLTIKYIKNSLKLLGSNQKVILDDEISAREKYCYSLKAKTDIKKGDIFSEINLILKSPRNENAKNYYDVLGKKSEKNYVKDDDII
jgi:sialic acid synthase SpsE